MYTRSMAAAATAAVTLPGPNVRFHSDPTPVRTNIEPYRDRVTPLSCEPPSITGTKALPLSPAAVPSSIPPPPPQQHPVLIIHPADLEAMTEADFEEFLEGLRRPYLRP